MAPELSLLVRVKNLAKEGLDSVASSVSGMAGKLRGSLTGMVAGFATVGGAVAIFKKAMTEAFDFERQAAQFSVIIKNADELKTHLSDLAAFSKGSIFNQDEIRETSKLMMMMTEGVLGTAESLKMVGEISAQTGAPIKEVGTALARAFESIKAGDPIGRVGQQLLLMGAISGDTKKQLEAMQEAGANSADVWSALKTSLGQFNGAMEDVNQTGWGLIEQIKNEMGEAFESFGTVLLDTSKGGLQDFLDKIREISDSGEIAVWADKTKEAIGGVATAFAWAAKAGSAVGSGIGKVAGFFGALSQTEGPSAASSPMSYAYNAIKGALSNSAQSRTDAQAREDAIRNAAATTKESGWTPDEEATNKIVSQNQKEIASQKEAQEKRDYEAETKAEGQKIEAFDAERRNIEKINREATELGLKSVQVDWKSLAEQTVDQFKSGMKQNMDRTKDQIDVQKEFNAAVKEANEKQAEVDKGHQVGMIEDRKKEAEDDVTTFRAAVGRAQDKRLSSNQQLKQKAKEQEKKAKDRAFTMDELDALRERDRAVGDLTKEEKLALKLEQKDKNKAQLLRAKESRGQKLSKKEQDFLKEANLKDAEGIAAGKVQRENDQLEADKNKLEKKQAEDISEIRKKIDDLLTLKEGG